MSHISRHPTKQPLRMHWASWHSSPRSAPHPPRPPAYLRLPLAWFHTAALSAAAPKGIPAPRPPPTLHNVGTVNSPCYVWSCFSFAWYILCAHTLAQSDPNNQPREHLRSAPSVISPQGHVGHLLDRSHLPLLIKNSNCLPQMLPDRDSPYRCSES